LHAGDVLLGIGDKEINSPSDLIRALRDYDAGDPVSIDIKRNRRDETLDVLVPENRYSLIGPAFLNGHADEVVSPEIADD
jgi:S1-C subfamily serine protease